MGEQTQELAHHVAVFTSLYFPFVPTAAVADLVSFVAIPTHVIFLEEYDDFAIAWNPSTLLTILFRG